MMDNELRDRLNTIENKLDEIIRYLKPYGQVREQQELWRQQQELASQSLMGLGRQINKPIGSK